MISCGIEFHGLIICYFKTLSLLFASHFLPANFITFSLVIVLQGLDWLWRSTRSLSPKPVIILGGASYTPAF